ncbi:hypothetical protein LCDV1gp032 [Lymphocystis disease virus 1]|uniref:hypothetical protein n=1 Tax=Fish lymphocystis disease virus TaxID=36363 RepID=UPI0000161EE4|nr:hypothetical protein LCDV1gp032 [Lymphocystis disease virus 1]
MIITEIIVLHPRNLNLDIKEACLVELIKLRLYKIYKPVGYIIEIVGVISVSTILCEELLHVTVTYKVNAIKPADLIDRYQITKLLDVGIFIELEYAHILIIGGLLKNTVYCFECCQFSATDTVSFKSITFKLKKCKDKYIYAIVAEHQCKLPL